MGPGAGLRCQRAVPCRGIPAVVAPEPPLGRQARLRRRVPVGLAVPSVPSVRASECGSHTSWLRSFLLGPSPARSSQVCTLHGSLSVDRGESALEVLVLGGSACVRVCAC